jgi:DNA-binding response OmpR family regulator
MKLVERFQSINPYRITGNDKFNLLIIEDDEQIRDALELSFQIYWPESKVEFSKLGKDGIQAAKEGIFDAILLDIILPDISGFEVLTNIRSFSNTPVIILTADHNPENVKKAHALGANDLILKPYKQKELLTSIKQNIDLGACIN